MDLETRVESLVVAAAAGLTVRRSRSGQDLLIEVERAAHRLELRIQVGGVLLGLDGSDAMEFAEVDDRDMADLARLVRAYCLGELEVRTGGGGIHAVRTSAGQLSFPGPRRAGPGTWRRVV